MVDSSKNRVVGTLIESKRMRSQGRKHFLSLHLLGQSTVRLLEESSITTSFSRKHSLF